MRKFTNKFLASALVFTLSLSLTACSASSKKADEKEPVKNETQTTTKANGTYQGKATGKMGDVAVSVTFKEGVITDVTVTEQSETEGIATPALEGIPVAIVDHQSVNVDTITGATMTSNAIIDAVKDCITQAGAQVEEYSKEVVNEAGETIELEADIVVVGAGAAGLMAAYNATKGGANVIVLEKGASAAVSNFAMCGGPAAVNTYLQEQEGAVVTVDQLYDDLYEFSKTTVNATALKESVIGSGVAVNTMIDLGIKMDLWGDPYGTGYRARHFLLDEGATRVDPIVNKIEEQGGTFYFGTTGTEVIMEDGKAVGMMAQKSDGTIVKVNAKAVLISTGGFLGNEDMIDEIFGDINLVSLGNNLSTGDGINMVLNAGGVLGRNFAVLGNECGGANTKMEAPTYNADWLLGNDNLVFWITGGLLVDRNGERFMNEKVIADTPLATGGQAIIQQGVSYAIIDQKFYEASINEGIYEYMGKPENWIAGEEILPTSPEKAEEYLQTAINEGWAFKADTIEELAKHFGLENLSATVDSYNAMCEAGEDTQFGKEANFMLGLGEGPYYAFEYEPSAWGTNGGVKVDSHMRAITPSNEAIEGLYVAGVDAGSIYASPYYESPGASVGLALGSGVYAAGEMLEYIKK